MTMRLSKDLEQFVHDAVRSGLASRLFEPFRVS
jgi:hypothetical protein